MLFEILADKSLSENQICDKIKDLVREDPEVLKLREHGTTPLHIAVLRNLPEVVSLLIKLGMSVNALTDKQQTPLHMAAISGLEDMIWLLGYQPDCDFNQVNSEKKTALHEAVIHAYPECVKNLLRVSRFKLDITLRDKDGQTAADILDGQEIQAQQLLEEAFYISNRFDRTPLHMAVIKNLDKAVQFHLKLGAPINAKEGKGRTALHLAVLSNHPQILLRLCHSDDIDMNAVDIDGWTALHHSVALMSPDCVKILVSIPN